MTRRRFVQSLFRSKADLAVDYAQLSIKGLFPVLPDHELARKFNVDVDYLCAVAHERSD